MSDIKLKYFEYFLISALSKLGATKNDFSVLKTQKLLFFTVAAQSNMNMNPILGETLFDNFRAYQYGPVEHTIYSELKSKNNTLSFITIDNRGVKFLDDQYSLEQIKNKLSVGLDVNTLNSIGFALDALTKINNKILNYSAFNLVELSHRWKCWSSNYSSNNTAIPFAQIKSDNQYYFI